MPTFVRSSLALALGAVLAGCGSSAAPRQVSAPAIPRLRFDYDVSAPLRYVDRGRVNARAERVAVHDVSFRSGNVRVDGYLVLPPGHVRRPAVVVVHGSGGDRSELLAQAKRLAAERGVVAFTITEPSTSHPPGQVTTVDAFLKTARSTQVRDVVAIRRALDVLQSLPQVDPRLIGYLGWSAGAKNGTFIAAAEPRVRALVLLSAGADPVSAFVAQAPPGTHGEVRRVLGSIDPLRYVAWARPGSLLLEDGTRDEIIPRRALENVVEAAPRGTTVRWFDARHALNRAAYETAFAWLGRHLRR